MAITLMRLLSDAERGYSIKLVAGKKGLNNFVRWVHTVEDTEVSDFVKGNELIFTTGIVHRDTDWILEFVKNLKSHGAAGLVLNMGPYIKEVPDNVRQYCNSVNFPLLTIPWEKRLIDVTYDFCHRIIANEEHEAGLATAFRNLIFNPENVQAYAPVLQRRGFDESAVYTLIMLRAYRGEELVDSDEWHAMRFQLQLVQRNTEKAMFMFVQSDSMILVGAFLEPEKTESYLEKLLEEMERRYGITDVHIGISNGCSGYSGVPECYREAQTATTAAKRKNKKIVFYRDMGIEKILYAVRDREVLREYSENVLGEIESYDSIHGSDYLETLRCYIDCDCSVQRVSEIMGVHRNTVNYKVKFMKKTFGFTFDKLNTAEIELAFVSKEILNK